METKTVNVDGRAFEIYRDGENWFELNPGRVSRLSTQHITPGSGIFGTRSPLPSRTPSRPQSKDAATLRRELSQRITASVTAPELSWPLGRYNDDVPVVPSHRNVQLSGYAIQFGVLSQPTEAGWREVVRPSALSMACRHRTPLWVQHRDEFVCDPDVRLSVDAYGLRVESFNAARHNRALHASVLRLIDEGVLHGMSIYLLRGKCGYHEYPDTRVREFFYIPCIPEISLAHGPRWPGTTVRATDPYQRHRQRNFNQHVHAKLLSIVGG